MSGVRPPADDISVGTFIKTPAAQVVELLALGGLDLRSSTPSMLRLIAA